MILYIALVIFIVAIIFFWQSARQRREAGLPGGRVIYTDTRAWDEVEKPLFSNELGLTGKPDYLVEQNGKLIPVEVKTGRVPDAPYDSHIFQLAAYCLLVEKTYGKRPPYGIIHYSNRDFAVDYTPSLNRPCSIIWPRCGATNFATTFHVRTKTRRAAADAGSEKCAINPWCKANKV